MPASGCHAATARPPPRRFHAHAYARPFSIMLTDAAATIDFSIRLFMFCRRYHAWRRFVAAADARPFILSS